MKDYPKKIVEIARNETIAYLEHGQVNEKPTLLMVHGNMSSSIHFVTLMERLEEDYHIVTPDLPGFGDSSYNKVHNSLLDFAKDLAEFVELLNLNKFEIIGWSTGGGIALELAYLLPEQVTKVYLLSSVGVTGYPMLRKDENFQPIAGDYLTSKEEIAADLVQVVPALQIYEQQNAEGMRMIWDAAIYINEKPPKEEYDAYLNEILKQRNLVDIDYSLVHFNITDNATPVEEGSNHIADIQCPIVIIHGGKDFVVPIAEAHGSKEAFGDQAVLHQLDDAGHAIVQDDMDKLVEIIRG